MFTVSSVVCLILLPFLMFVMIRYANQIGSFDNRDRRVGKTEWDESAAVSLDMPRKNLYRSIILNLEGLADLTDVTTPPVLYTGGLGSALKLIKRVELVANGRDTIKSISGDAIGMKKYVSYGNQAGFDRDRLDGCRMAFRRSYQASPCHAAIDQGD